MPLKSYLGVTRRANYCTICCVLMKCTDPRLRFLAVNSMDLSIYSLLHSEQKLRKSYIAYGALRSFKIIQGHRNWYSLDLKVCAVNSESVRRGTTLFSTLFSAGRYRPLGLGLCHRKSVRPSVTLVYCGQTV